MAGLDELLRQIEIEKTRRAIEGLQNSTTPLTQPPGGVSVNSENASALGTQLRGLQRGAEELMTYGFVDNGVGALSGGVLGGMPNEEGNIDFFNYDVPIGERYSAVRDFIRDDYDQAQEAAPGPYALGQVLGGIPTAATTGALVGPGKTMLGTAGRMFGLGGVEGGLIGAGLADGENVGENAGIGAVVGALMGGAAVPVVAGIQRAATDPIGGLMDAIRGVPNPARAGRVVSRAFNRAGMTPDDVLSRIGEAAADGQDMFRTADALGLPGQRQLAGINRSPGDASRVISEWLDERQLGQTDRVAGFLGEAIGTDQTAQARQLALQAERRATGDINYGDARMQAGPVEVSPSLDIIDQRLSQLSVPGMDQTLTGSPLDRTLQQIRARLAVPAENLPPDVTNMQLSDFGRVFEVKRELDGAIAEATRKGNGFEVQMLTTLRNSLDDALATASQPYAGARDTYRQQSQVINAVDAGREAARPGRTQDALDAFNNLAPQQTPNPNNVPAPGSMSTPNPQDGFRVGYIDPLLRRMENVTPTTNSVGPLTTPKNEAVLGAISEDPELLARRLAREMEMFQTRNMATGGSPTANLLQDIEDVADTSPNLAQIAMNPTQSIINALGTKAGNFMQGTNEQTRQLIARVLMSADPQKELEPLLRAAMLSQTYNRGFEAIPRQLGYQAALPTE